MSYTSSDPEFFNRDPETSSLASTSTTATTESQKSNKKKKPWSKFKSSIKSIGEKMSSRPKFTDSTESSEQKKVNKRGKRGKASSSGESRTSTPEETPRAKSPTKTLMKKFSVESISTPFVGYQPASVNPGPKSYARALHKSGSTSESNLSASDIDTPKKSLTLDRNTKFVHDSPDSGRASQTMGSTEGSRPPSQIKEEASDVSVDSDYTSPRHGGLEEGVLDDLVTKTEQFAQSLVSPKVEKEKDADVSVDFLKAETGVETPPNVSSGLDSKNDKVQHKVETPSGNLKEENKDGLSNIADETKFEVIKRDSDSVDGRKKRESKQEDSSSGFIKSERSIPDPVSPVNSETKQSEKDDKTKPKTQGESLDSAVKPEKNKDKERSHERKDNTSNKDISENKKNKDADADKSVKPETKPTLVTNEKKESSDKQLDKPESKSETATKEKTDKTPSAPPKDEKVETDPANKEGPKQKIPQTKTDADAEKSALSKSPSKTKDVPSPLTDVGPTTPETSMSVEEKLQAFLSAEGWSGTIKDASAKTSSDGSQQPDKRECLYKILVIGELGTGKTSIIKRYVHQFFSQHYRATIGVDFALKVLNWDSNTIIRLQLWDIAGQERFGNMTRVYYKEAVGAFIVFDVTRSATFDAVLKWKQDLDSKVQLADGSHIPCVLLANKCDQQKEGIVNTPAKMDEYCKENNFSAWFEVSAKENINIDEAAKSLVTQILQNDKSSQNGRDSAKDGGKFPLDGKSEQESKSCAC